MLVGLKYFQALKVLKIFGQNVSSLKPLTEVASTLEELWICEGQLKGTESSKPFRSCSDLTGAEQCTSLKKLFLYENQITCAKQLSLLNSLEILHLEDNALQDLLFLETLNNLFYVNIASNNLSERGSPLLMALHRFRTFNDIHMATKTANVVSFK